MKGQATPQAEGSGGAWKKRNRKKDTSKRISLRLTDEEFEQLNAARGDRSLSDFVRGRILGSGVVRPGAGAEGRNVLRKVAALHDAGSRLKKIMQQPGAPGILLRAAVDDVRRAIETLAATDPVDEQGAG